MQMWPQKLMSFRSTCKAAMKRAVDLLEFSILILRCESSNEARKKKSKSLTASDSLYLISVSSSLASNYQTILDAENG